MDASHEFLSDKTPSRQKRDTLIDQLIGNEAYIDYWTNKWADLLQVNRKFLGPEGAKLFRGWIHDEVKANTPYDAFCRKILTATGSNKANPPASYYKILRTPEDTMENTTHLFLAVRFNCNKCHDHPFERWTQDQYYEMAAYFSQVELKKDPAAGDKQIGKTAVEAGKPLFELISDTGKKEMLHERTGAVTPPAFPYSATSSAAADKPRREQLAHWITAADNQYFARSYVNRVMGYLTGTGVIEPLDDIRAGNPPSNPELLDWLTNQFVQNKFNVRELMRTICKSRTYQLSVQSNPWNEDDSINYSHAKARRLPAEVLYDTIYTSLGAQSAFPGVPAGTRAAALPDVGVKLPDGFLGNLGRPSRESACECERSNELQLGPIMALVSGPTVGNAISDSKNALSKLVAEEKDDRKLIDALYLRMLSRHATDNEIKMCQQVLSQIDQDHKIVTDELAKYEAQRATIDQQRETDRLTRLKKLEEQLAARTKAIAADQAAKAKAREEAIAAAEKKIAEYNTAIVPKVAARYAKQTPTTPWTTPEIVAATAKKATLKIETNQVIYAEGKLEKDVYTVTLDTELPNITGVRLEVLADDRLPQKGPGRNGNFVLTELKLFSASSADLKKRTEIKFKDAKATFNQNNYNVKTAIDGKLPGSNNGWAIAGGNGKNQTAVFMVKGAVKLEGKTRLTFELHQAFNDNKHQLGKFRVSITGDAHVDLAPPAEIGSILAVAAAERTPEQQQALTKYYKQQDPEHKKLVDALNVAKRAVPMDPVVKQFNDRIALTKKPLGEDPVYAKLKRTAALSQQQLGNKRLTATQDIAWALINTPAFLFNR